MKQEDALVKATEFGYWDEEVESVLLRQSYFGRNKAFGLDNQAERLTLGLAKLLMNHGIEDANTFAKSIPTQYENKNWESERKVLLGRSGVEDGEKNKVTKRKKQM